MLDKNIFDKSNKANSHIFIRFYDESYYCLKYNENVGIRISFQDQHKNRHMLTILETRNLDIILNNIRLHKIYNIFNWFDDINGIHQRFTNEGLSIIVYKADPLYKLLENSKKCNKFVFSKPINLFYTSYTNEHGKITHIHDNDYVYYTLKIILFTCLFWFNIYFAIYLFFNQF